MEKEILAAIYFSGLLFAECLRIPQRIKRFRTRRLWKKADKSTNFAEWIVLTFVILGMWTIPSIYAFTSWLSAFDFSLPKWPIWIAVALFLISLLIRLIAQRTLAQSWSFTIETSREQMLIQRGIYSFNRHPLYFSLILWAIAQPGLLHNYLAGFGGAAAVILIWLVRVPNEEKLMLEVFGDEYRGYMERTGRFTHKVKPPSVRE